MVAARCTAFGDVTQVGLFITALGVAGAPAPQLLLPLPSFLLAFQDALFSFFGLRSGGGSTVEAAALAGADGAFACGADAGQPLHFQLRKFFRESWHIYPSLCRS